MGFQIPALPEVTILPTSRLPLSILLQLHCPPLTELHLLQSLLTAPPPASPAPTPSPDLNGNVYTIKAGDSLWGIARKFGTSVNAVKETNGMTNDTIIEGRSLIIPGR
jgi:LysM repeat protein